MDTTSAPPNPVIPVELQQDHKVIGAKVRVVTASNEIFEGIIFTMDPKANFLVLEEQDGVKFLTHIFYLETLKDVKILESPPAGHVLALPSISANELERVEQRYRVLAKRVLASIGQNVSGEAQTVFDALNKTMPCAWEDAYIRVMGEVLIKPPYRPQNCMSTNLQVLSRVKIVLEGEQRKLMKCEEVDV